MFFPVFPTLGVQNLFFPGRYLPVNTAVKTGYRPKPSNPEFERWSSLRQKYAWISTWNRFFVMFWGTCPIGLLTGMNDSSQATMDSPVTIGRGIIWTRGVTIRLATIRYISRYTTHDMVHDTIQNQLIYYQWKILKHCGMCQQYCYIKTVILARNSEFKINKDVHNHPCPKYLLLPNGVCKQNNKIS